MNVFLDIEVYRNYFLALFLSDTGKVKRFEIFNGDTSNFDPHAILAILTNPDIETVTFNGTSYDVPLLTMAMLDPDTKALKAASDRIIQKNLRPWNFYRDEGLQPPKMRHIDLIDVAPGMVSLKIYGGRMGSPRLQDLPIAHTATIQEDQLPLMRKYCRNDASVTQMLFDRLTEQLNLRRAMSKSYGIDLLSKSDAQIAEAVLKAEFQRLTGDVPPKVQGGKTSFYYDPPAYIRFATKQLQDVLETVRTAEMVINPETGHVKMPKEIAALKIKIGGSTYKIGIGGLHSQESETAHFTDDEHVLIDRDVESYYPRMMLNMNMQPGGFGKHFNTVYGKILEERLAAKHKMEQLKEEKDRLRKILDELECSE